MTILSKWVIKKEEVDGQFQYAVYQRCLWKKTFYARFNTKHEAINKLQEMCYPQLSTAT
jgi:hypothetical protein